ncbi:MAG: NifB/NifX family molybdenum-iron cluster-binding protein [Phycisphaerae bacterium]|nr:NifB/NifX family molybdenum-iron cluster-binding protein [Phycisphaerae bacterium]
MTIAITATGADLDATVEPRFGRCPYFLIVNTEDMSFEAIENANVALGGGAGVQSAQLMADKGVTHVLTGNCGPNAHRTLSAAGIGVIVGCSGAVRDAVAQYKAGQLSQAAAPNVASHFGVGGGGGGMGMGRGMGRGMGMGRGAAQSTGGMGQAPPNASAAGGGEDVSALKQQADALARQMEQINRRIAELEQGRGGDEA